MYYFASGFHQGTGSNPVGSGWTAAKGCGRGRNPSKARKASLKDLSEANVKDQEQMLRKTWLFMLSGKLNLCACSLGSLLLFYFAALSLSE